MIDWTGERYLPEVGGQIELEHIHRYMMVLDIAKNKRVLDIACGEGYGSNLISGVAKDVVGVDIAEEAVAHANEKYKNNTVQFLVGSCASIPIEDNSVDLIVSFETIEHHDQHEKMFEEFLRVLAPEGIIIISSPDKHEYSDVPNYSNPYHVKELYRDEFERLVEVYFKNMKSLGQRVIYGSLILADDSDSGFEFQNISDNENNGLRALYNIVVASNGSDVLPNLTAGVLEGDILKTELVLGLQNSLNTTRNHIETLNHQLAELYESSSWKLTKPLRWVMFKLRKILS